MAAARSALDAGEAFEIRETNKMPPTLVLGPSEEMRVMQEEILVEHAAKLGEGLITDLRALVGRHESLDLPSAAHNLLLTHPAEVAAALRAFCGVEG